MNIPLPNASYSRLEKSKDLQLRAISQYLEIPKRLVPIYVIVSAPSITVTHDLKFTSHLHCIVRTGLGGTKNHCTKAQAGGRHDKIPGL